MSQQLEKSPLSQSEAESSKNFSSRVRRTVESIRVIDLQARINVESNEILYFLQFFVFNYKVVPCKLQMAPNKPNVVSTLLLSDYFNPSLWRDQFSSFRFTSLLHS